MDPITTLATRLGEHLRRFNAQVTTAESCTGGGIAEAITRMNLEPQLGDLKVKAVFVAGEHDGAAPAEAMKAMAAKADGHFRVVKDAAHLPNLEQPSAFNAILCEWLAAD